MLNTYTVMYSTIFTWFYINTQTPTWLQGGFVRKLLCKGDSDDPSGCPYMPPETTTGTVMEEMDDAMDEMKGSMDSAIDSTMESPGEELEVCTHVQRVVYWYTRWLRLHINYDDKRCKEGNISFTSCV